MSGNVHCTYTNQNLNIIAGLEMLQDWSFISPYFASTPFVITEGNDSLLFLGYILYNIVVVISFCKLIYDINLKFQIVVHTLSFMHELINLAFMLFLTL